VHNQEGAKPSRCTQSFPQQTLTKLISSGIGVLQVIQMSVSGQFGPYWNCTISNAISTGS